MGKSIMRINWWETAHKICTMGTNCINLVLIAWKMSVSSAWSGVTPTTLFTNMLQNQNLPTCYSGYVGHTTLHWNGYSEANYTAPNHPGLDPQNQGYSSMKSCPKPSWQALRPLPPKTGNAQIGPACFSRCFPNPPTWWNHGSPLKWEGEGLYTTKLWISVVEITSWIHHEWVSITTTEEAPPRGHQTLLQRNLLLPGGPTQSHPSIPLIAPQWYICLRLYILLHSPSSLCLFVCL